MEYNFLEIEKRWQHFWAKNKSFKVEIDQDKPKFYVLDMFPYPSGAGLHVGHPLGYIASDIYSRFKTLKGFNVLHPMGFDAFGLPAEQYAIETGTHPAVTTDENVERYIEQLNRMGFSYDWDRGVKTSDPSYYKWTQWAFIEMFNHWYNKESDRAESIDSLVKLFEKEGNSKVDAATSQEELFTSQEWLAMNSHQQAEVLMNYRIAYQGESSVNWCPALGTVLANDEVREGISLRGGHPVVQRKMTQWLLRVSAYAERLLSGLDQLEWSDSLKEMQRNWIGRSEGAAINFEVSNGKESYKMEIYTTRADTIFGATFMVLAPESDWTELLTTEEEQEAVTAYIEETKMRSERERMIDTHRATGVFSGSYALNPFTNEQIPIWISDYVLAGYGSGAIMAVPAHDSRDYLFAKEFNLPIIPLIEGCDVTNESFEAKEGVMCNSGFLNGLTVEEAIPAAIEEVVKRGLGEARVNYRLRDAIFSRQRYWGEPFPIYYKEGIATALEVDQLPLELPEVDKYLPTEEGEPPLARAEKWEHNGYPLEYSTMPGFAGSSAYYLRYMDPTNENQLVSKEANSYWKSVDLYIGGTEHATGHLIYSRFWNKFLYDLGYVVKEEPFEKLVNQGMIQGRSNFVYRVIGSNQFVSHGLKEQYETTEMHVDVSLVDNNRLNLEAFKEWRPQFNDATFILEDGEYICGWAIEKMSKSMFNVVNPDTICDSYGADTLRMYEMFLGPLEHSKPWDTNGIDGVHRFLRRFWRLFFKEEQFAPDEGEATAEELKVLHRLIQKVEQDIENFSFNTAVSAFMSSLNQLYDLKCTKRAILEPFLILLSPFAPHIGEELWHLLGHKESISKAAYPQFIEKYIVEENFEYPVSFNGKLRFKLTLPASATPQEVEAQLREDPNTEKYLRGAEIKKVIVVPKRIINVVC